MQQTKLGLRKLKESKESQQERYKCHKVLKQNPLIRLDVRNKSVTLLAKELGGAKIYVDILIGKGYSVGYDLFYDK
ncbi:hypothetical protein [Parabacteroides provencensis]|uniref:hypothetical protein n=1 Tax=Parabacteroides provencensis TaxID=1944636 RepID=UPI00117F09B7|nr:hypothetical protein [Parabacteroides provencensis]